MATGTGSFQGSPRWFHRRGHPRLPRLPPLPLPTGSPCPASLPILGHLETRLSPGLASRLGLGQQTAWGAPRHGAQRQRYGGAAAPVAPRLALCYRYRYRHRYRYRAAGILYYVQYCTDLVIIHPSACCRSGRWSTCPPPCSHWHGNGPAADRPQAWGAFVGKPPVKGTG